MKTDSAVPVTSARVGVVMKDAKSVFRMHQLENPDSDAEWLMMYLLRCSRSDLFTNSEKSLSESQREDFKHFIDRRIKGEPPQYIVGETEFYGRTFMVNPPVLIPRPETERLIDEAIPIARSFDSPNILDIGSGSGNISITLAMEISDSSIMGIDVSTDALAAAEKNKNVHGCKNLTFACFDILKEKPNGLFHIIVSNPPYITSDEMNTLMADGKYFEPKSALTDDSDGLKFYKSIAAIAPELLVPEGWLILEVGGGQHSKKVYELFHQPEFQNLELVKDFNGDQRILKVQFRG